MTHDELLEKINQGGINAFQSDSYGWLALRAVVELHKPYPTKKFGIICKECEISTDYPCPTIQAIEKELL